MYIRTSFRYRPTIWIRHRVLSVVYLITKRKKPEKGVLMSGLQLPGTVAQYSRTHWGITHVDCWILPLKNSDTHPHWLHCPNETGAAPVPLERASSRQWSVTVHKNCPPRLQMELEMAKGISDGHSQWVLEKKCIKNLCIIPPTCWYNQ